MDNLSGKIIIIDDSESIQLLFNEILNSIFDLVQFLNPIEALKNLETEKYDCIILDLMMPELSGTDFLKTYRNSDKETPIIVLTAKQCGDKEIAELFKIGASDFVTKPFLSAELIARLNHHIKLKRTKEELLFTNKELQDAISREEKLNEKIINKTLALQKSIDKIKILNKKLKYFAAHDKLTGFLNRRAFFAFLENDIKRLKRIDSHLTILMLDLDFFKNINDTYGHLIGDFVLAEFSKQIKKNLRDIDLVCRYGGEEFLILLTDSDIHQSLIVSNKLREIIEQFIFCTNELKINITVSIGAAEFNTDERIDSFIKRVDEALYVAKKTGRNKVVAAE